MYIQVSFFDKCKIAKDTGIFISLCLAYGSFSFVDEGKVYGFHPGLIGLIINLLITILGSIFINRHK